MAEKIVLPEEEIHKIVQMLNNDKTIKLDDIAAEYKVSKKTIARRIKEIGYIYNRVNGLYEMGFIEDNAPKVENKPELQHESKKTMNKVGRPALDGEYVKRTYTIPKELDRALRIKAAVEDKKVSDILREALELYVGNYKNI